ncbi:hypothetical protein KI387_032312 [Taxus chinensis]|uniref:DNA-directed DNA polymerase n=1 Tax=Taxus chinensis TaxID=29808 RepID=A0AA38BNR8_TAXCH|nr:hypothetical protein KI387_032312 [Taxus chinensis]
MAMGVTSQGPSMPCLPLHARHALHFASTPTFHLQSTGNWSSFLQRHPLMATKAVIAQNSHLIMAEEAQIAVNSHPVMSGEAKLAQNRYPLKARKEKVAYKRHSLMVGEEKDASNRHPVGAGGTKIASKGCLLVAGDARNASYGQMLLAGDTKIAANRSPLMECKEVKRVSNGYRQGNSRSIRYIGTPCRAERTYEREKESSSRQNTWFLEASAEKSGLQKHSDSRCQNSLPQKYYHENPIRKEFAARIELNSHSPWRKQAEKYRIMKQNSPSMSAASGTAEASSQHTVLHTSPASEAEEISSVIKTLDNGNQKAWSEENSVQEQELERPDDGKTGFYYSLRRQVGPYLLSEAEDKNGKGKGSYVSTWENDKESRVTNGKFIRPHNSEIIACNQVSTRVNECKETDHMDDLIATGGIFSNVIVEAQPEELFSELKDKNGKEGGYWSIGVENKDTVVTNSNFASPNDREVSASNQVATGVTDYKGDNVKDMLDRLYKQVFIVNNVETAKTVVGKLMGEYRNLAHACDTEVADIDVKKESPVGHGKVICFSIYCGSEANFGDGKSCVWVDVLDGGEDVLSVFAPYFEDSSIRKVFHNYSFDMHVIGNHGINVRGFYADTMHLARLWNSARREEGGYSLEALTMDPKVMNGAGVAGKDELIEGKVSMKTLFGKKNIKKDGSEGKTITIACVEELQRTQRMPWICYSALDSISTWRLWKSLQKKLKDTVWVFQGDSKRTMYDFYEEYWRPFGELLVQMESKGMLVDREYLSKMEEVAIVEQEKSALRFKNWASTYCPDAKYMNVGSDTQVRQLLFGGIPNKKDPNVVMPNERTMKVPNVDNFIEEGKKTPGKYRNIVLCGLGVPMEVEKYTMSGWPTVSSAALKALAGKVSVDYSNLEDEGENDYATDLDDGSAMLTSSGVNIGGQTTENKVEADPSVYGTAYGAFGGGKRGKEACQAIAALCEVSSINTLISNFLQPLQGKEISGIDGRVHCSLNINTETGRLSARKPNLQNQPALEKDRYKIRQAFIADSGNSLIVADYGQLELRILAHLSNCKSMLDAFKAGGDFHSRTAMNMYPHVRDAVEKNNVLLEWDPQPGEEKPPLPLLKDVFATERRKAKMLNFSIAYGKTAVGLSKDWKVTLQEAKETVNLWYKEREEVSRWQEERKHEAQTKQCVYTLLGRARHLPCLKSASFGQKGHIERAAINTPVQGSAADVAMCAMLEIARNARLKELGWTLVLQVHDEVILEGPTETAEEAKLLVVDCMSYPFYGKNILRVDLAVDAKYAPNWYAAK